MQGQGSAKRKRRAPRHRVPPLQDVRDASRRRVQLQADLSRLGLRPPHRQKIRKTFDPRRREGVAGRARPSASARDDARADEDHAPRGRRRLARGRGGRHDPQPLRRPLQALGAPRLRGGARRRCSPTSARTSSPTIRRVDVQDLADRMLADGLDPSTIRNALMPLRAIYRRAVARGEVAVNPTAGLELPAVRGRRDRIASPEEAAALIAALYPNATGRYGRPRSTPASGAANSWRSAGRTSTSRRADPRRARLGLRRRVRSSRRRRAGRRTVPIAGVLRDHLVEHKLRTGRRQGSCSARRRRRPFDAVRHGASRAATAWTSGEPRSRSRCTRRATRSPR